MFKGKIFDEKQNYIKNAEKLANEGDIWFMWLLKIKYKK